MATNLTIPVKPKKSVVAGKAPLTTDLEAGEISINFADGIIYGKSPSGSVLQLAAASYNDLSNKPTLGTAAATAASDYATAAQGAKADTALQPAALTPYRTSAAQDTLDANKVTNGGGASTISVMTQAAYTALAVKDNNTIYILT